MGMGKALARPVAIQAAHAANLRVHVWTFRAENEFLPADLKIGEDAGAHGNLEGEIKRYLERGIDGFFVDFPALGVRGRDAYIAALQLLQKPLRDTSLPATRLRRRLARLAARGRT